MEKIISEFRVIETDDGFRIEIKGDKERMKSFMHGFGKHRRGRRPFRRGMGHACGPFGFGPMMWAKFASHWGEWDFEEEEEEETEKD